MQSVAKSVDRQCVFVTLLLNDPSSSQARNQGAREGYNLQHRKKSSALFNDSSFCYSDEWSLGEKYWRNNQRCNAGKTLSFFSIK